MKKFMLFAVVAMLFTATNAQVTVKGSKFTDNWSLTLKGGGVAPFQHYRFWPNTRGIFGAELRKQVTSVLGLGVEGEWTVNTSSWGLHSANVFDHQLVGGFATINMSNWIGGYKGYPRMLELEAVAGAGWLHAYYPKTTAQDYNSAYVKFGANVNLNLGEARAWTISLKPAVVWDMNSHSSTISTGAFNANKAMVEMEAGVTYHFSNSNGEHYMTLCPKQYTQEDLDGLNAQINDLRGRLGRAQADADAANRRADRLQKDLDECNSREPEKVYIHDVEEVDNSIEKLEVLVYFNIGKHEITAAQMPNVERVAIFLKNHPDANVVIKGYASKDGNEDFNIRLANNRAAAVRNALVNKYKIAPSRIQAEGNGISEMFSELEWNRVSICTIFNQK